MKRAPLLAFATLTFAAAGRADVAGAAVLADVFDAFPAVESALPTNGRLVFFGAVVPDITFVRTDAAGTETTLAHAQIGLGDAGVYVVTLGDLVAGESVVVSSRCATCAFTATWTVAAAADDVAPAFDDGPAAVDAFANDGGFGVGITSYSVSLTLPNVTDAGGASPAALVLVTGESGSGHRVHPGTGNVIVGVFEPGGAARTACYDVVAVDAAGNATPFASDVCTDLAPPGGCAQAGAAPFATVMLVLLAWRRRRAAPRR